MTEIEKSTGTRAGWHEQLDVTYVDRDKSRSYRPETSETDLVVAVEAKTRTVRNAVVQIVRGSEPRYYIALVNVANEERRRSIAALNAELRNR